MHSSRYTFPLFTLFSAALCTATAATVPELTNPYDRVEATDLYQNWHLPDMPINFTGDVQRGIEGTTSDAYRDRILTRINLYRAFAGVPSDIVENPNEFLAQQRVAMMLGFNNKIPTLAAPADMTWRWWSPTTALRAGSNPISLKNGVAAVDSYITDGRDWGYRYWLLNPGQQKITSGDVYTAPGTSGVANSLFVGDLPRFGATTREDFFAWPNAGFCPAKWISEQWTVAGTSNTFDANTRVTAERILTGATLPVTIVSAANNQLIFTLSENGLPKTSYGASDLDNPIRIIVSYTVNGARKTYWYDVIPFDPNVTTPPPAPTITAPTELFVRAGDRVTVNVAITNAFRQNLTLSSSGSYNVVINQSGRTVIKAYGIGGYAEHTVEYIVVPTTQTESRLANISLRADTKPGDDVAIAGFVISGGTKRVLARVVGPTLTNFGIGSALTKPQLKLYKGQTYVSTTEKWAANNAAGITEASTLVGAFALDPNSADAATVLTLEEGSYTIQAVGVNNTSGTCLVEVYDLDQGTGKLVNISSRALVGATDDKLLIDGFVISGDAPRKVLIRGIGPTLESFGVSGTLADPIITVRKQDDAKTVVGTSDNWGSASNNPTVANATARSGAFALVDGSKDAAIVLTLQPGAYTVVVEGKNRATGVALAEIYDLGTL